jgi:hypothetical protein
MAIRLASDLTSFNQLRRLGSDATGFSPDTRVSVRLRALNGERILVRKLAIEIHEPYTTPRCVEDLTRLGFDVRIDRTHHAAAMGVRPRERARSLVSGSERAAVVS